MNIPRPKKPYLVLNPIDKSTGNLKTYYLVSFSQKKLLNIGRKKDSDIIMDTDSSISRHHTKVEYVIKPNQDPCFLIEDNESKFGTLVLLKKPLSLEEKYSGLSFQVGGSVLTLEYGNAIQKPTDEIENFNESDSESSEEEAEEEEEEKK